MEKDNRIRFKLKEYFNMDARGSDVVVNRAMLTLLGLMALFRLPDILEALNLPELLRIFFPVAG